MFIGGINMSKKLLPDDSKLIELYVKDKKLHDEKSFYIYLI